MPCSTDSGRSPHPLLGEDAGPIRRLAAGASYRAPASYGDTGRRLTVHEAQEEQLGCACRPSCCRTSAGTRD